jgi:hypothetical protein
MYFYFYFATVLIVRRPIHLFTLATSAVKTFKEVRSPVDLVLEGGV